mgnify:FL=1
MLRLSVERKLTRKMPNGSLTCFKSSEKNRLQNCLTVSNIQLGNVVSDTFGKSAQAILDKFLENPADTSFDLEPLVYKSLKKNFQSSVMPLTALLLLSRPANSRSSKIIMITLNPGKQSLKNSFLRSPLPISRNLPFFKPLLASAVTSLPSESFPKSVPTWRLFLRRNTYVHGLVLPRPTMKAQGRKNLFGFPRSDATSNRF